MYASSQSWRMLDAYFADVGVVNRLARRGELLPGSELYGKAFENWVFHELSAFVSLRGGGRSAVLLAIAERHRGGLPARGHRGGDRSQGERANQPEPPSRPAYARRRAPRRTTPRRRQPRTACAPHRGRHRHSSGNHVREPAVGGGIGIGGKARSQARRVFIPIPTFPHQGGRDYRKEAPRATREW